MELPSIYSNSSDDIKNIIIQFGSAIFQYLNLNKMNDEEVIMKYNTINNNDIRENYEDMINVLNQDKDKLNSYHKNETKHIREEYEERIKDKEKVLNDSIAALHVQVNTLRNENMTCENEYRVKFRNEYEDKYKDMENNLEKNHKEKIDQLEILHKSEVDQLKNELKITNERILPLLDNLTEKKTFNNSTEQGDYGEGFIDEIVNKGLPFDTEAFIDDSSKVGGSGDRIIRFKNGTVMMVEVKNENIIKKGDREQFQEHSKKDFEENKCNCALFLSLRTQQIPKIGKAIIPIFDNNMVYFGLDNDLSLPEKKMKILSCIEEVYKRTIQNESISDEIKPQNNEVIYNQCLENLNNQKNDYESIIKDNEKNADTYRKKLIEINKKIHNIWREAQNNNINLDEKLIDEKSYVSDFILRIKKWKEQENKVFKKEFRNKIKDEMVLSELDKTMLKKIKLSDIQ